MQTTTGGRVEQFWIKKLSSSKDIIKRVKKSPTQCVCMYLYKPVERLIYFWWEYKLKTSKNPEWLT